MKSGNLVSSQPWKKWKSNRLPKYNKSLLKKEKFQEENHRVNYYEHGETTWKGKSWWSLNCYSSHSDEGKERVHEKR